MSEPFDEPFGALGGSDTPVAPRAEFVAELRAQLELLLVTPDIPRPPRAGITTGTATGTATHDDRSTRMHQLTPYLAVHDGAAALDFYTSAFGAREVQRVVMDDGKIGHAELTFGSARVYLADEYPSIGVTSPRALGGTSVTLHVEVDDIDSAFAAAVAAGAESISDPADQAHGARHGTLVDPFGHRWMLSQQIQDISDAEYASRLAGAGATVHTARAAGGGGIWAAVNYADAVAGIDFIVDVLGFERSLVVRGADPTVVEHSQLRWPEGGVVQAASANRHGNLFSQLPTGAASVYVITADPRAVHARCVTAGAEIVVEPSVPDYDPGGLVFTVRDPEGNLWSFGSYAGEQSGEQ